MKLNQAAGGVVSAVEPGGLADRMGIHPGDVILTANGYPLRDVIDFRYYSAEEEIELDVRRDGRTFTLSGVRQYGRPVGLEFAHPTFDVDIRRCANKCEFCFVTQSPRGMRRTVYIKDDDYRYSFLFGHFVTLTNLDDEDWERIEEQHLSPLYVSVHATELDLRRRLLVKKSAPDVLEQLRWLGERGIQVHTQLVLIPGLNDGPHLDRSLRDLCQFFPTVQSVSVVPIGLTRYHSGSMRTYRPEEARAILDQADPWRERCRRKFRLTFVYPSDEWYLVAGRPVPPAGQYDGFGQIENGVGMIRQFLDEWETIKYQISNGKYQISKHLPHRRCGSANQQVGESGNQGIRESGNHESLQSSNLQSLISNLQDKTALLVCGELAAPLLRGVAEELNALAGCRVEVAPVVNNWYGVVTVSGLLTGRDVVEQLRERTAGQASLVLLPRVMFDNTGQVTLDDMAPAQIQEALQAPVAVAQHPADVLAALRGAGQLSPDEVLEPKPGWWGEHAHPVPSEVW